MHVAPIKIQMSDRSTLGHRPEAWWIPGGTPREWIEILANINAVHRARIFLLPACHPGNFGDGLICLPAAVDRAQESSSSGRRLHMAQHEQVANEPHANRKPPCAIPLRRVRSDTNDGSPERELWIPLDAEFAPQVCDAFVMKSLTLSPDPILVWLPRAGLIGFKSSQSIALFQLIQPPQSSRGGEWKAPPDGVIVQDRIGIVRVIESPTVEELFEQERRDIGGTPYSPDGLSYGIDALEKGSWTKSLSSWFYKQVDKIAQSLRPDSEQPAPRTKRPAKGTGISERLYRVLAKSLEGRRHQQIEKLLKMLQSNPDLAIKYAIPLSNTIGGVFRGLSMPGWTLSARSMSLNASSGGSPIDPWSIRDDLQRKLRESYREQANREIALGRYRRAAYIYAHLLGELATAASVLEKGNEFREAALIYEKLHRPLEQARCMMLAGRPGDAALIFESNQRFESAGDAWLLADDEIRARAAFENAISQFVTRNDPMNAVRIMELKLNDRARAESFLWEQWPSKHAALAAAQKGFGWLGESRRHDEARERLRLLSAACDDSQHPMLANLAIWLFENYPDASMQIEAEDLGRVATATQIRNAPLLDVSQRVTALAGLARVDSLLSADAFRYLDGRTAAARSLSSNRATATEPRLSDRGANSKSIRRLMTIHLPLADSVLAMQMIGNELLAISRIGKQLRVDRGIGMDGSHPRFESQTISWDIPHDDQDLRVAVFQGSDHVAIRLHAQRMRTTFPSIQLHDRVGTGLPWAVRNIESVTPAWACAYDSAGSEWIVTLENGALELQVAREFTLKSYAFDEAIAAYERSKGFDTEHTSPGIESSVALVLERHQPYFSWGNYVLTLAQGFPTVAFQVKGQVNAMIASAPRTQRRLAIASRRGLDQLWIGPDRFELQNLCQEFEYTHVAWGLGGVVGLTPNSIRVLKRDPVHVRLIAQHAIAATPLAAMTLHSHTSGLGMLLLGFENGRIERYCL